MKQYNEYRDKLISVDVAILAESVGYDVYGPECFTMTGDVPKDAAHIYDEWSGMIADGNDFLCYRPTITGLQKWLREEHRIHVFIGFRVNLQKFDSYAYPLDMKAKDHYAERTLQKFRDQELYDNYEDALEAGVRGGLQLLLKVNNQN